MASLFSKPKEPKPNPAVQRSQRRQDRNIQDATMDERRELGARRRMMNARRSGGSSLLSTAGGAGVKETLG